MFCRAVGSGYGFRWDGNVLYWERLWEALLADLRAGLATEIIAARFHHTLATAVADASVDLCEQHRVDRVVLNGDVLQNRLLLEQTADLLRGRGLMVLTPSILPANDGGLSLGQAVIGAASS